METGPEMVKLVEGVRRREPASVERWIGCCLPTVKTVVRNFHCDADDREDMVQECLLHLCQHAPKYDGRKALLPWVVVVSRNRCKNWIRYSRRPRQEIANPDPASLFPNPPDANCEDMDLATKVAALTDIDRRILGLRYGEEMSHREIGKIIGMEPDAVRKRISRALIRLREIAGGDEES